MRLDSVPDEEIGKHLFWLSGNWAERLSVLLSQIAAIRELQDGVGGAVQGDFG